jgi:hypothetical protein
VLHLLRGEPSDEELAALTAVLAALTAAQPADPPAARSAWADPAHGLRISLQPGPSAWRTSLRPR